MSIEERRERERAARRQLIVATARAVAEAEGWDAVTTRRLSTEIEYSQPVLYKHFSSMEQVADAVALDGYAELAEAIRAVGATDGTAATVLSQIAYVYLNFARDNPAVYDVMFTRSTLLRYADEDTPPELSAAFAALSEAVAGVAGVADGQAVDTLTEVFWAALHGMATLGATGRLPRDRIADRVRLLVDRFAAHPTPA
ncbi:TetR/AcrR family transcriptional regulator [Mycolicibacterium fluoranthenivorans]|uniref:Transcriptional regulator, TetR family n=1 Tax=Mycolicibacterium fluoranthenivorans TaxID=258505 RepID=A0A1G4W9V1_9MYCO|nr:TetR/AcrR family transcriptional regulator [Mycolicibacterium fluoranthenivorans]SCX19142.1 transcriptional regulator, TetR family [Mycolicibacterium fluoranthenivorans]